MKSKKYIVLWLIACILIFILPLSACTSATPKSDDKLSKTDDAVIYSAQVSHSQMGNSGHVARGFTLENNRLEYYDLESNKFFAL